MILKMQDLDLAAKRVLIRQDLNVPIKDGEVANDARIRASLPTIKMAIDKGARVMLMSHLGRPTEGEFDEQYSLAPVAVHLSELLGFTVRLESDWLNGVEMEDGEVVLCENVRFNQGEKANDESLAKAMASLCDVYVMDAFGTAHRAQASTHGVGLYAPVACAGPLLSNELDNLALAMQTPKPPVVAIVGGSKVSTKLTVLESLSQVVDQLIVGGGIANTFIAAAGYQVGKSLYEPDLIDQAKQLIAQAEAKGGAIPIPSDVVCGKAFAQDTPAEVKSVSDVQEDDMIFDIGPKTTELYQQYLENAGTVVWNGPVGVFEFDQFAQGTEGLAHAISSGNAFSIAGGGDTLAAIDKFDIAGGVSYVSTGGGAFLEFLEGKELPAVAMLKARSQ